MSLGRQTAHAVVYVDRARILIRISKEMNSIPKLSSKFPSNRLINAWKHRIVLSGVERAET